MTLFGIVESGVHFVLYEGIESNGVLVRINDEAYTEIDSVYAVTFQNRPVAYREDIYLTHKDPEVGSELFVIDYEKTSVASVDDPTDIVAFPNPFSDVFQLDLPEDAKVKNINILDHTGRVLITYDHNNEIKAGSLNAGFYFVRVTFMDRPPTLIPIVKH